MSAPSETTESWRSKRARYAALVRGVRAGERPPDDPALIETRRDLAALRLEEHVLRVLADAPPLTDEQRTRLAELLRPVRVNGGGDHAT